MKKMLFFWPLFLVLIVYTQVKGETNTDPGLVSVNETEAVGLHVPALLADVTVITSYSSAENSWREGLGAENECTKQLMQEQLTYKHKRVHLYNLKFPLVMASLTSTYPTRSQGNSLVAQAQLSVKRSKYNHEGVHLYYLKFPLNINSEKAISGLPLTQQNSLELAG